MRNNDNVKLKCVDCCYNCINLEGNYETRIWSCSEIGIRVKLDCHCEKYFPDM